MAWQEVQELALGCLAIAGIKVTFFCSCAVEIGSGAKAILYLTAATAESVATAMRAQRKMANGQGRTRSLVGVQLNRALPRRGGVRGCKGEGRPAFSRVRLPQNIFRELATSDASALRLSGPCDLEAKGPVVRKGPLVRNGPVIRNGPVMRPDTRPTSRAN